MDIVFGTSGIFNSKIQNRVKFICEKFNLGDFLCTNESIFQVFGLNGESKIFNCDGSIFIFDGYLSGDPSFIENQVTRFGKSVLSKTTKNIDGLFNLIISEKANRKLILTGDPSGNLPLYYYLDGNQLYYSTHLNFLAQILNLNPDFSGITQKSIFGYTLGSKTAYQGVKRLNPSETITFEIEGLKLSSNYNNTYYSKYIETKNVEELVMEKINSSFQQMRLRYDSLGLMLSEGFDSRFIGILAKENGFSINSYTHCTANSKGKEIINEVQLALGSKHFFNEISAFPTSKIEIQNQLIFSDNLNLPFWMEGANYFHNEIKQNSPIMVGTALDTTLGGHAFYKPTKPIFNAVWQRYSEIFKQDFRLLSDNYIENLSIELLNNFKLKSSTNIINNLERIFSKEISSYLIPNVKDINNQIEEEIERIRIASINPSQILQRFFLENRVRKFSFGQELTIRRKNKIYIPTYEFNFMEALSAIHPRYKFNHKLYLKIMNKYMANYSNLSNGTYGMKANYNRFILETSRFFHKQHERVVYRNLMKEKGAISPSNFRSAFITDYLKRDQNEINRMHSLLSSHSDTINVNEFKKYFERISDYKQRTFVHSTFYQALEAIQVIKKEI
jgi:hypothetical protein